MQTIRDGKARGGESLVEGTSLPINVKIPEGNQVVIPDILVACPAGNPLGNRLKFWLPIFWRLSIQHVQRHENEGFVSATKADRVGCSGKLAGESISGNPSFLFLRHDELAG